MTNDKDHIEINTLGPESIDNLIIWVYIYFMLKLARRYIWINLNFHFYFYLFSLTDVESENHQNWRNKVFTQQKKAEFSFVSSSTSDTFEHLQVKVLNAGVFFSLPPLTG